LARQGKRHNQALIALAIRRCDVLFAMLRTTPFANSHQSLMLDETHSPFFYPQNDVKIVQGWARSSKKIVPKNTGKSGLRGNHR
jgi:hypothetical protein